MSLGAVTRVIYSSGDTPLGDLRLISLYLCEKRRADTRDRSIVTNPSLSYSEVANALFSTHTRTHTMAILKYAPTLRILLFFLFYFPKDYQIVHFPVKGRHSQLPDGPSGVGFLQSGFSHSGFFPLSKERKKWADESCQRPACLCLGEGSHNGSIFAGKTGYLCGTRC